ncbi:MAG: transposase, partial [Oscillospiraceae bacterium]
MELPKRKQIRLQGYDYSQNGAYFVTICVKDRHELLGKIIVGDDAHIVPHIALSQHGMVAEKYMNGIIGINKCIIMPNHIHMIIVIDERKNGTMVSVNPTMRSENGTLRSENGTMWASSPTGQSISQLIKSFKTLVTKEIGFSLWQRSFHDHIIRNERDYQK